MLRTFLVLCVAGLALPAQAAEHTVIVEDSRFDPAVLEIAPGDSVTWTNQGNLPHNVDADDGSFTCAQGCDDTGGDGSPSSANWSFTRTFDTAGDIPYHCDVHGAPGGVGMSGTVTVKQSEPEGMPVNFGHTGSWFNQEQDGQGFSLEVVPVEGDSDVLAVYWFTYAPGESGGVNRQRWFTGAGPIDGSEATVAIERVTGGIFDDPQNVARQEIGTATFRFTSCTEASVSYSLDLNGDGTEETTGEIPLVRLTPDVLCEERSK